jgi:hypothetical protein
MFIIAKRSDLEGASSVIIYGSTYKSLGIVLNDDV